MHVAEATLTAPVIIGGAIAAAAGVGIGLKKLDMEQVPRVAVLASAMFVAALIRIPIGPTSAHLILNGLAGLLLGWTVFPAMLVALVLQAILFGYGGITVLGVNTVIMALPGLISHYAFRFMLQRQNQKWFFTAGLGAGILGVGGGFLLLGTGLFLSSKAFLPVVKLALTVNLPVMIIEGLVSGSVMIFLMKVKPEMIFREPEVASVATRGRLR